MNLAKTDIDTFRAICGADFVLTDRADLDIHGADETEDLCFPPEVVVLPRTTAQVQAIMKHCSSRKLPVTPRGAGTGLSGYPAALLSRNNDWCLLEIDPERVMRTAYFSSEDRKFPAACWRER